MAQAKRKNTTAFLKTADAKLYKLHDEFFRAYAAVLKRQDGGQSYSQRCSFPIQRNREKSFHARVRRRNFQTAFQNNRSADIQLS
jgi:hypothetical protein